MAENRKSVGLRLDERAYSYLRAFAYQSEVSMAEAARLMVTEGLLSWISTLGDPEYHRVQESVEE